MPPTLYPVFIGISCGYVTGVYMGDLYMWLWGLQASWVNPVVITLVVHKLGLTPTKPLHTQLGFYTGSQKLEYVVKIMSLGLRKKLAKEMRSKYG